MKKKEEKPKIDHTKGDWSDQFDDLFYFVRGAFDLVKGYFGLANDDDLGGVRPESVYFIMREALERLDQMKELIDGVWNSISEIGRLPPEKIEKLQSLRHEQDKEFVAATNRISDKYRKRIARLSMN